MNFENIALSFLLSIVGVVTLSAQSARAFEKAGDKAFAEKDYYTAFVHFQDAMERSPKDVGLWYKYAEVTRQFNAYEEAEKYYSKVVTSVESSAFPLAIFWLGQVKKNLGKYQEAIENFETFLKNTTDPDYYSQWANEELNSCRWAMADPEGPSDKIVRVERLDKKINTPFSEFGAVQMGPTLYYSSFRFEFPEDDNIPERKLSKVLTSENLSKGRVLGRDFNQAEKLTAHATFDAAGSRIYFTICEYVNASEIRCEIVYRDQDKRGRWEKTPVKLPEIINMKGFTSTQPSIGFDSVTQKEVLYFVSDRPGGKGKLDLWYCELEENKFLEPKNLEAFNTPENDISPFFHVPSQTLYFSSDGRGGLGGYDVFSAKNGETWSDVSNVGKPVNTSYNDIYYSLDDSAKGGFVSSNRPGSFYLDPNNKTCCNDIYRIFYKDLPETPEGTPPPPITIVPTPTPPTFEKLEDFLPLALYFDNDEPDKRTNRTTTKKTYEETFEKYYPRKGDFIQQYTKPINNEEEVDEATLRITDFFEEEVKTGFDHLRLFSEILLKRLEKGERVEIIIKGYTSPRAKSDYNDYLAQRRISSLRNQFEDWQDGIFQPYLKSGKLVISEAPFGETQAASGISDDLFDERNSIYSVGASLERRVEIIEVK
ncbi:MAG: hypothetical protein K9J37_07085 [Saprospiraceae bacterium]|nr:hypothetical protein [Saprospiraceae bacterium]MCF8249660.1 hypothetical protein [Saprospiraceae bacterium]MCF8279818.1 hypothetical protein [Bacteroidales bacterium]MCF8312353.1 hypothetical protein [Saprospiraceae bacterium]MCF8440650.1 hypothetical protein [Saprospiraceae bacterium]